MRNIRTLSRTSFALVALIALALGAAKTFSASRSSIDRGIAAGGLGGAVDFDNACYEYPTGDPRIDFEGLGDSIPVTNQYPNVVFARATAITAGLSLNEFEAPPHSGSSVIFDDGGPILISFAAPITSLAGYFTYSSKITLVGFDENNVQVATTSSKFNSNFAVSGETGDRMNELLSIGYNKGIARVLINGAAGGSSFALDDLTMRMSATGVRILFHDHGQSTELKETSPQFQGILASAEEILKSSDLGKQLSLIVKSEDIDSIKRDATSVELLYDGPKSVDIGKLSGHVRTIRLDRVLIALSGKYGRTNEKDPFATIFYGLSSYGAGPYTNSGPTLDALTRNLRLVGLLRE